MMQRISQLLKTFCNRRILCYNQNKCEKGSFFSKIKHRAGAEQKKIKEKLRSVPEKKGIKMTVDNTFMIKKLQAMKTLFAVYSPLTKMPYVECDPETFDDQIHLFESLEKAKAYCEETAKNKIPLAIRKLEEEKQILPFYHELYQNGVNAVLYHDEKNETRMELGAIIRIPDWDKMEKRPVFNPLLQLTAAYFFQEARRPDQPKDNPERNRMLHEREEEMLVNIARASLVLPVIEKPAEEGEEGQGKKLGAVILKNNKNEIFQPVFTDFTEIAKMYPKAGAEFKIMTIPFPKLIPQLLKESTGFVINPAGFNLVLNRKLLELIAQRFLPQEEQK